MTTLFRFYNNTADTWHLIDVENTTPVTHIEYSSGRLLTVLAHLINHTNSFSIVPVIDGEYDFIRALNLSIYSNEDIEYVLNYMENLS